MMMTGSHQAHRPIVVPRLGSLRECHAIDGAASDLERIGHLALARARKLARCTTASCSPIEAHQDGGGLGACHQRWLLRSEQRSVWCGLDASSQQALLSWLVGACASAEPSALERTIVSGSVRELVAATPEDAFEDLDALARGALPERVWRCTLRLLTAGAASVHVVLVTERDRPRMPAPLSRAALAGVRLPLRAAIAAMPQTIGDVARWRRGSIVHVGQSPGELGVVMYVGRRPLADAALGLVAGRRALRLRSVATAR